MKKDGKLSPKVSEAAKADKAPKRSGTDGLLDMEEAIASLKTTRPTFYRWLRSGRLKGMKVGRQWRFYRADIERFLNGEAPQIDLTANPAPLLETLAAKAGELGIEPPEPAKGEGSPIAKAMDLMIRLAFHMRASDLHVGAQVKSGEDDPSGIMRVRVDGVLHPLAEFDSRLLRALVDEWKSSCCCDLHERAKPQDGRILFPIGRRRIDLRVSFVPTALGEAFTARLLDADAVRFSLDILPFDPADRDRIKRNLKKPCGVVLCVGPAGSGKTTTLYGCLNHLNEPGRKLISIEDPVEYILPGVTQIPVRESAGLNFAAAMRSALRQDPDVMMMGEIKDRESLLMAQRAALTGHLVISALHTESAAAAIQRMVEMGAEPFLVADSTRMVVAQRLLRCLCPKCKRRRSPDASLLEAAERMAREGGLDWDSMEKSFYEPSGCPECRNIGYRGRTAIAEVLEMTPEIGAALRRGLGEGEIHRAAIAQGMTSMAADGIRRAAAGKVALEEVLRVCALS